eukprot:CAMPEP_0205936980 /NCGR_PEP_ID=MMETSP1325-20131115/42902_1 /ASSEMBLY_ACC=CAM_ASM_000708 /TAXON_ID=236786 /ORGANISM="Florenciella sp., Strain RCC1007" /LENGTH=45 /DNA_ID= /DNA_START= /DNA_END= /DNA_ORIENTATION=
MEYTSTVSPLSSASSMNETICSTTTPCLSKSWKSSSSSQKKVMCG